MRTLTQNKKLGFSLIELSVVILIIGILIVGVTKGSRLIRESKIKSAKSLTAGSIVQSTEDLVLWLDSVEESNIAIGSFDDSPLDFDSSINDGDQISSWRIINTRSSSIIDLTTDDDDHRPTYVESGINGLPSMDFDGVDDFLTNSNGVIPGGSLAYTMIGVFSRSNYLLGNELIFSQRDPTLGNCAPNGRGMSAGLLIFNNVIHSFHCGEFTDFATADLAPLNTPMILTVRVIKTDQASANTSVYINGAVVNEGSNSFNASLAGSSTFIGTDGLSNLNFEGLISEIIIVNKALKNSEIIDINDYLSQKYNIELD
ncbi:MAG: prepilin-type N-terminal cleavage/methylation domain-containing protein [Lentimonas sp.]|jgi:prepilin-type N-terminal cleavage/methylation domain-containing protein